MTSKNQLPLRVPVSALEAESIFQKFEKINRDVKIMERVEKLERPADIVIVSGYVSMCNSIP